MLNKEDAEEQQQAQQTRIHTSFWTIPRILFAVLTVAVVLTAIILGILAGTNVIGSDDEEPYWWENRDFDEYYHNHNNDMGYYHDDHNTMYAVKIHWQGLAWTNYAGSQAMEWNGIVYLREGTTAAADNGNVAVTLRDVDGNVATMDIEAVVDCCVRKWHGVVAIVDDDYPWGPWSDMRSCACSDSTFDHQVQAAINYWR